MKFKINTKGITKFVNRTKFKLAKHSPEILLTTGIVGIIGSFVIGCVETTKVNKIIEEHTKEMDEIKVAETRLKDGEVLHTDDGEEYTEKHVQMDRLIVKKNTAVKIIKNYTPSVIMLMCSLGCVVKSHSIMRQRYAAITAAYTGLSTIFKEYRSRVVSELGEEADKKFRHGISTVSVTNNDGNITTEEIAVIPSVYSPYAKFFDESSPYWEKDPEFNLMFLRHVQNTANNNLVANGILFLNDVYEALGLPKTKAGQVVGWIYDPKNPIGDNYVDFGIYNANRQRAVDFVNGYERTILLDFNVDGNVWELME